MVQVLAAFSLAVAAAQWQPDLPSAQAVAYAAVLAASASVVALRQAWPRTSGHSGARTAGRPASSARTRRWLAGAAGRRQSTAALLVLAGLLAGYAWSGAQVRARWSTRLPERLDGVAVDLRGWVDDLPQPLQGGTRITLNSTVVAARDDAPLRIALTVPEPLAAAGRLHGGACLQVRAKLQAPHGLLNFEGFDADAWMWSNGIMAAGRVVALSACDGGRTPWRAWLEGLRDRIRAGLQRTLGDRPAAGIVVALVVGDQGGVSQEQWTLLWRSGIGHLVSISGSHVTVLAAALRWLCERLWRRSAAACRHLPAQHAGALVGLLAALAYALVAGFAVPTRRTVFMIAAGSLCALRGCRPGSWRVLWIAVAVTLACDPFAALSPSFWLSFGAVAGLVLAGHGRLRELRGWRAEFAAQWISNLTLLPLIALWFGQVSLVAPLANLVAIPLVGMVITPLALAAMFPGLQALALPAEVLLEYLLRALAWLVQPDWAAIGLASPAAPTLMLAGAAVLLLLQGGSRWPASWWALPALLPVLAPPDPVGAGALRVELTDIGQGLAVLVRTHRHALLFDSGPRWSGGDAGTRTLLPLLRAEGIVRLDRLVLSHPDADHVGGADSLLAALAVGAVESGFLRAGARPCLAGEHWSWDGVAFEFLHPPDPAAAAQSAHQRNNHACVLRIASAGHVVLLPADIEAPAERALLGDPAVAARLRSDVVVVAHHGSHTSSSADFVAATQAGWALVSLGWHNRYHHPDPAVVERWQAAGARVLRTDLDGALRVDIDGSGVKLSTARDQRAAVWRSSAAQHGVEVLDRRDPVGVLGDHFPEEARLAVAPETGLGERHRTRQRAMAVDELLDLRAVAGQAELAEQVRQVVDGGLHEDLRRGDREPFHYDATAARTQWVR